MTKTSISDETNYTKFCEEASKNDVLFKNFRTNNHYTEILEHVTKDEGSIYLQIIKKENPELLKNFDKYKTNDIVGQPNIFNYEVGLMSPTTLRYVKVLGDLINNFGDLNGKSVVEIGCGYGGQAKIITDTFDVKSYTLIDLKPVLSLTKKYLTSVGCDMSKINFETLDSLSNDLNYDLFISNYAFTECNKKIQSEYFDRVISKSKMGYITANFINQYFNLDFYTKEELMGKIPNSYTLEEKPKTHPNNIIILWK